MSFGRAAIFIAMLVFVVRASTTPSEEGGEGSCRAGSNGAECLPDGQVHTEMIQGSSMMQIAQARSSSLIETGSGFSVLKYKKQIKWAGKQVAKLAKEACNRHSETNANWGDCTQQNGDEWQYIGECYERCSIGHHMTQDCGIHCLDPDFSCAEHIATILVGFVEFFSNFIPSGQVSRLIVKVGKAVTGAARKAAMKSLLKTAAKEIADNLTRKLTKMKKKLKSMVKSDLKGVAKDQLEEFILGEGAAVAAAALIEASEDYPDEIREQVKNLDITGISDLVDLFDHDECRDLTPDPMPEIEDEEVPVPAPTPRPSPRPTPAPAFASYTQSQLNGFFWRRNGKMITNALYDGCLDARSGSGREFKPHDLYMEKNSCNSNSYQSWTFKRTSHLNDKVYNDKWPDMCMDSRNAYGRTLAYLDSNGCKNPYYQNWKLDEHGLLKQTSTNMCLRYYVGRDLILYRCPTP